MIVMMNATVVEATRPSAAAVHDQDGQAGSDEVGADVECHLDGGHAAEEAMGKEDTEGSADDEAQRRGGSDSEHEADLSEGEGMGAAPRVEVDDGRLSCRIEKRHPPEGEGEGAIGEGLEVAKQPHQSKARDTTGGGDGPGRGLWSST